MRFIPREEQERGLRLLVEILPAVMAEDSDQSYDALCAIYGIADILGGKEMISKLEVKPNRQSASVFSWKRFFTGIKENMDADRKRRARWMLF